MMASINAPTHSILHQKVKLIIVVKGLVVCTKRELVKKNSQVDLTVKPFASWIKRDLRKGNS